MASDDSKQLAHTVGVEGARPYGVAGVQPADAVMTAHKPAGVGVPYVSDTPYNVPYNERPLCTGIKTNNEACRAKARPEGRCCDAHVDQE